MKQYRILVIRPDRLGDVVLSTPLPREIKKKYPESFVGVLLKNYTKDIYLNNPYVDIVLTDDYSDDTKTRTFFNMVKTLRKYKFTHALMLMPTERINWMLFWAGIKTRVGVGNKFYQFITFTKSVSRNKYIPLRHEADYCLDLIRKIGIEAEDTSVELFLSKEEIEKKKRIRDNYKNKILIGIQATSGKSAPNLSPGAYRELAILISKNNKYQVAVMDKDVPKELQDLDNVIYPTIDKTLREAFVDYSALDILISSSTGPMHICAGLKLPTLSLFCPLPACSPKLWGPEGNISHILMPEKNYCSNSCPGEPKKCDFSGEGGIEPKKILEELNKILMI